MKTNKYSYERVIQGMYENQWCDLTYYDCKSTGSMDEQTKKEFYDDLKAYRTYERVPIRCIIRRTLKK